MPSSSRQLRTFCCYTSLLRWLRSFQLGSPHSSRPTQFGLTRHARPISLQNLPFLGNGKYSFMFQMMAIGGIVVDTWMLSFLMAEDTDVLFLILLCLACTSDGHGARGSLISPTSSCNITSPGSCGTILTLGCTSPLIRRLHVLFKTRRVWFQEGLFP